MVLLQPVERVREQEVPHLRPPEVEDERAPVGMRAPARVGVLVQVRPVEGGERPVVAREVGGHPVEDHADAALVEAVDEVAEVVGCAEARRRRVVAGHLVAPRAGEGMLHHRQQLDVREAEVRDVVGELVRELAVAQRAVVLERVAAPGAEMDLVHRHRPAQRVAGRPALEPLLVAPDVLRLPDDRRVGRRHLGVEGQRVALQAQPSLLRPELELVLRALADAGDEQLPDPGLAERAHRVQAPVPGVEVADDRDGAGVRSPDREGGADHSVELADVRAEPLVQLLVAALHGEVEVELAERRQERVRIADGERVAVRVLDLELVLERQPRRGQQRLPEAGRVLQLGLDRCCLVMGRLDAHSLRLGPERAHDDAAVLRFVGAENAVRVGSELDGHSASAAWCMSRSIPATGIPTQSGRLSSS